MAVDVERENGNTGGTPTLPGVPPAIRSEWQKAASLPSDFEADDADLDDISTIINGNKAITGKAVYSANQAGRNADQTETQKADQKKHEAEVQEARELMHLAEWNGQITNVGGVEMTNEQAQKARQHIIDNEDYYAHRAVKEGRIHADEEEEYKYNNRRITDLKDKEGRKTATAEDQKECERRQNSRVGRASEHDAAESFVQKRDQELDKATRTKSVDASISTSSITAKDDPFQSAPKLTQAFTDATTNTTPLAVPDIGSPSIAVRDLKSTGLAI